MPEPLTGNLLVAGPLLIDPNFFRAVVLVCAHAEDGALGLVLNRPTDIAVGDHLPGWVERLAPPSVVFSGGPVQPETAIGLGRHRGPEPTGWTEVTGRIGFVDLSRAPGEIVGDLEALRVYSGYAGWGPGQLEEEILRHDWMVFPVEACDPFLGDPGEAWRRVLKGSPGRPAWYADFPLDPRAN